MSKITKIAFAATLLLLAGAARLARAHDTDATIAPEEVAPGAPAFLREISFRPVLRSVVPLDAVFRDESGVVRPLSDYVADRPFILVPVYYRCGVLCDQTLMALASSLRTISLDAGHDFQVIAFSIDPADTPASAQAKRESILPRYHRERANFGWHFLTGAQEQIERLCGALGFRYGYDPARHAYAHASGIVILTSDGKVSRYLPGIEFPAEQMRLSLLEASQGRVGSAIDRLVLYCYQYDPTTGKYGASILRLLRLLAVLTVLGVVLCVAVMRRRQHALGAGAQLDGDARRKA